MLFSNSSGRPASSNCWDVPSQRPPQLDQSARRSARRSLSAAAIVRLGWAGVNGVWRGPIGDHLATDRRPPLWLNRGARRGWRSVPAPAGRGFESCLPCQFLDTKRPSGATACLDDAG